MLLAVLLADVITGNTGLSLGLLLGVIGILLGAVATAVRARVKTGLVTDANKKGLEKLEAKFEANVKAQTSDVESIAGRVKDLEHINETKASVKAALAQAEASKSRTNGTQPV